MTALQAEHEGAAHDRRGACVMRRTFTTSSGFTTSADATDAPLAAIMRSHSVSWLLCAAMLGRSRSDSQRNVPQCPTGKLSSRQKRGNAVICLQYLQGY